MKRSLFVLGATAILSAFSSSALAVQPSNAQLVSEIQKINQETNELKGEVKTLKAQLRHQKKNSQKNNKRAYRKNAHPVHMEPVSHDVHPFHRGIITVTTSPWMGLATHFRPSDILERQGSMNEDLYLLQQKATLLKSFAAEGNPLERPVVQLSGAVEGQASQELDTGAGSINLNTVEFDVNAIASNWANLFFTFDYDGTPAFTGSRQPNGRIFLQRGFLTIGDLNRTPFYFSMGQMYAPFGTYYSWILTTPINESVFRILQPTMLLGFATKYFYGQIYAFTGDRTSGTMNFLRQGGFNLGFNRDFNDRVSLDIGGGMVSNVADSQGMQNNRLNTIGFFNGFGVPTVFNNVAVTNLDNLQHDVGGADAHAELTIKPFTFVAEYQSAIQHFASADMTFNGRSALPQALHTEIDYDFRVSWMHFKLAGIYDESWQSYALTVPLQSYAVALLTSIWKDTAEGIEFRHDTAYGAGTIGTGGTINGVPVPVPVSTGHGANIITGQIGVYF